jgi:type II secretory pathway component GspD/PulD (secretin)
MATKPPHATDRRWSWSILVGLLIALTAGTSAWPLRSLGTRMHVAVHEGQLSVDLHEAPVREVLAAIGQQAGLRVSVDGSASRTVNAQFTAMELDQGLRHLLRAASLSYALRYIRGSAGTGILQEVRVFGEERGGATASLNQTPGERVRPTAALPTPSPQEERVEEEPAQPAQEGDGAQE